MITLIRSVLLRIRSFLSSRSVVVHPDSQGSVTRPLGSPSAPPRQSLGSSSKSRCYSHDGSGESPHCPALSVEAHCSRMCYPRRTRVCTSTPCVHRCSCSLISENSKSGNHSCHACLLIFSGLASISFQVIYCLYLGLVSLYCSLALAAID
jgi:hypothetical protein